MRTETKEKVVGTLERIGGLLEKCGGEGGTPGPCGSGSGPHGAGKEGKVLGHREAAHIASTVAHEHSMKVAGIGLEKHYAKEALRHSGMARTAEHEDHGLPHMIHSHSMAAEVHQMAEKTHSAQAKRSTSDEQRDLHETAAEMHGHAARLHKAAVTATSVSGWGKLEHY